MNGAKLIIQEMQNRLKHGRNVVVFVTGKVGTGKSYFSMRLCELIDPSFDASRVCFTAEEFLNQVNEKGRLKKGNAIMLDEVGIMAGARDFQNVVNKALSKVFQIFRHRQLFVVLTVPHERMADVHLRASTDYRFQTLYINQSKQMNVTKIFIIKPLHGIASEKSGLFYYEAYPRYRDENGMPHVLKKFALHKPSQKLCWAYEMKAGKYKRLVVKESEEKTKIAKEGKKLKLTKRQQVMKALESKRTLKKYMTKGKLDKWKLAKDFDLSEALAHNIVKVKETEL